MRIPGGRALRRSDGDAVGRVRGEGEGGGCPERLVGQGRVVDRGRVLQVKARAIKVRPELAD
jgi:hypothetical protein